MLGLRGTGASAFLPGTQTLARRPWDACELTQRGTERVSKWVYQIIMVHFETDVGFSASVVWTIKHVKRLPAATK